jgi:hypothetical protein
MSVLQAQTIQNMRFYPTIGKLTRVQEIKRTRAPAHIASTHAHIASAPVHIASARPLPPWARHRHPLRRHEKTGARALLQLPAWEKYSEPSGLNTSGDWLHIGDALLVVNPLAPHDCVDMKYLALLLSATAILACLISLACAYVTWRHSQGPQPAQSTGKPGTQQVDVGLETLWPELKHAVPRSDDL